MNPADGAHSVAHMDGAAEGGDFGAGAEEAAGAEGLVEWRRWRNAEEAGDFKGRGPSAKHDEVVMVATRGYGGGDGGLVNNGFEEAKGRASVPRAAVGGSPSVHPRCGAFHAHDRVERDWAKSLVVPGIHFAERLG